MKLYKGQTVRVRLAGTDGDWCSAEVAVVSPNGISVGLALHGTVRTPGGGMISGALPLFVESGKVTSLFGDEYQLQLTGDKPK